MAGGSVPPGWYPDPGRSSRQRYWDGREWTVYAPQPPSLQGAPPQYLSQPSYAAGRSAQGLSRRAKIGLAIAGAAVAGVAIMAAVIALLIVLNSGSAPSQSYQFGYNKMGPASMANVRIGSEPEALGAITARACTITMDQWQTANETPSWWDYDDVLHGCVKYGTEFRRR
jgi:hypothetical protein